MKHKLMLLTVMALSVVWAASCGANETKTATAESKTAGAKTSVADAATSAPAPEAAQAGWRGKVTETMNSGGYSYVKVDTGGGASVWAAGPQTNVKVGDTVQIPEGMLMSNFESKSLQRTFDQIYFVPAIFTGDGPMPSADFPKNMMGQMPEGHPDLSSMMPEGHPNISEAQPQQPQMPEGHPDISAMMAASHPDPSKPATGEAAAPQDFSGIKKAEGGQTVAEVIEKKADLVDKEVTLRAKVVKYNEMILGKNWVHLRDGSGQEGANDLTVTTNDKAAVGDLVLVKGTLRANRDFGHGYKYDLLIENASVTVEKAK